MADNIFLFSILLITLTLFVTTEAQNSPHDYVHAHNEIRAEVGVGPVTWNDTLAVYAQEYVNSKVDTCELEHSNGPYGENLAMGYGEFSGLDAVKLWADEKGNYQYNNPISEFDQSLHYTQLVWRDTHQIGCAGAKCNNGYNYISCNYCPPGNFIGQLPY